MFDEAIHAMHALRGLSQKDPFVIRSLVEKFRKRMTTFLKTVFPTYNINSLMLAAGTLIAPEYYFQKLLEYRGMAPDHPWLKRFIKTWLSGEFSLCS